MHGNSNVKAKGANIFILIMGIVWLIIALGGYIFDPEHMLVIISLAILGLAQIAYFFYLKFRKFKQ